MRQEQSPIDDEIYNADGKKRVIDSDEDMEAPVGRKDRGRKRLPSSNDLDREEPQSQRQVRRAPSTTRHSHPTIPSTSVKGERSASITAPPTMTKKQERDAFNRSESPSSSSPPPAPPPPKPAARTLSRAEAQAALERQHKHAASPVASSSKRKLDDASTSRSLPSATTSSSSSSRPTLSAPKALIPSRRVSNPIPASRTASSSRPKPRQSDPTSSSSWNRTQAAPLPHIYPEIDRTLAERPTLISKKSIRVDSVKRLCRPEQAWEAFTQFGKLTNIQVLLQPKADTTQILLVTFEKKKRAKKALEAINTSDFPANTSSVSTWARVTAKEGGLKARMIEPAVLYDSWLESWLVDGVWVVTEKEGTSSSDEEPAPKKLKPSSPPKPPLLLAVASSSKSSSTKPSTNAFAHMDIEPSRVQRSTRAATAPAQTSNFVDRKGKGREVIDLGSSSDMDETLAAVDLDEVAGMDRLSLEPTRNSNTSTPAPNRLPAPRMLITNNDSSADEDDDDASGDPDNSDAGVLDDLPVAAVSRGSASSSSSHQHLASDPSTAALARVLPVPEAPVPLQTRASAIMTTKHSATESLKFLGLLQKRRHELPHRFRWAQRLVERDQRQLSLLKKSASDAEVADVLRDVGLEFDQQDLPARCKTCRRKSSNPWLLTRHVVLHDPIQPEEIGQPRWCDRCPRTFKNVTLLKSHQTFHFSRLLSGKKAAAL